MSIYFIDGQNLDRVDCGSPSDFDNIFVDGGTAMAWFNALSYGANGFGRFFDKSDSNSLNYGWAFHVTDNEDSIQFAVAFFNIFFVTRGRWNIGTDFLDGKFGAWHHAAVTYNSGSGSNNPIIYFDGVSQSVTEAETPSGSWRSDAAYNLTLGNSNDQSRTFWGNIEDSRLYNRILTANEIETIYNARGVDGIVRGLVGRYQMGAGAQGVSITDPTTLQDVSDQKHDGSILADPQWEEGLVKRRRRVA